MIIYHTLAYNLLLSLLLYYSLYINPRMWLHRMPPEVVAKVPPKTPAEKKLFRFWGSATVLVMVGHPLLYVFLLPGVRIASITGALLMFFVGFTLWDTLILDLLLFASVTPAFIVIPGTEPQDYKNKRYHLVAGAKGLAISLIIAIVLGFLVFVIRSLV